MRKCVKKKHRGSGEKLQFFFFKKTKDEKISLSSLPSLLFSSSSRRSPIACRRRSLGSSIVIEYPTTTTAVDPVPVVERVQQRQLPRELDLPHQVPVVLLRQARPPPGRELARL